MLYGTDDDGNVLKRMISIDKKELAREMRERERSFENTIYELKLSDNTTHVVTPRQLQVNPRKYPRNITYHLPHKSITNATTIQRFSFSF